MGDYDQNGVVIQQAIWLGDLPVGLLAKVSGGATRLFYVEPDALGTPRVVVDPSRTPAGSTEPGTIVWRWDLAGEGFGNDKPNEDPDNDSTAFVLDMRFPGQQYDSASDLSYNYMRDYEAATGRYVESDPIGLRGGISTYGYVRGRPMTHRDRRGTTYDDVVRTMSQVLRTFPELHPRGGVVCSADVPIDDAGDTVGIWDGFIGDYPAGTIRVPITYCQKPCLGREDWEKLFSTLFHEGMHSTDSAWKFWGHDEIYNREYFEMGRIPGAPRTQVPRVPVWGVPLPPPGPDLDKLYSEFQEGAGKCCKP